MKSENEELTGEEQHLRWGLEGTPFEDLTNEEFLMMRKYCETLKEDWVWEWGDWNHYERNGIHYLETVEEYLDQTCCPYPEDQKPEDNVCIDAVPLPNGLQWLKRSKGRYLLSHNGEDWFVVDPQDTWSISHSNSSFVCFQGHVYSERSDH